MLQYIIDNLAEISGVLAMFILFFDRLAKLMGNIAAKTENKTDDKVSLVLNKVATALHGLFSVLGLKVPDNAAK